MTTLEARDDRLADRYRPTSRCAPAAGRARALTVAVVLACLLGPGAHAAGARRWFIHSVPLPAGAVSAELTAVSCPSAATCTAVGDWSRRLYGDARALVERYDRGRWTLQTTPALRA